VFTVVIRRLSFAVDEIVAFPATVPGRPQLLQTVTRQAETLHRSPREMTNRYESLHERTRALRTRPSSP
jgi:hypothetical protein